MSGWQRHCVWCQHSAKYESSGQKEPVYHNEHTCSLEGNIIVVSAKEARYITTRGERCVLLGWALRACCIVAQVSKACLDGGANDLYAPFLCLVMVEQGMQLVGDRRQEPACPP